jgi:DNA-binding MarR family transcriptional regulator
MSPNAQFGTPLVGQVESAFGAILDRELAGTGLDAAQWITLTLVIAGGGSVERDQLVHRLVTARRISESDAQAQISQLAAALLLQAPGEAGSQVTVTDSGRRLHRQIGAAIGEITHRLWGDLPSAELETAGRVLSTVLERAQAELNARS